MANTNANANNGTLRGSFLKLTGRTCALTGAVVLFSGDVATGIGAIVLGLIISSIGSSIDENKRFENWKAQVEAKNLVPKIRQDMATAISVYNTFPNAKTLAYIRSLNPDAAKYIEEKVAQKK